MAKQKITISFGVSPEVSERVKTLFPDGKTEQALIDMLDAYENRSPRVDNQKDDIYRTIVKKLCANYEVAHEDLIDFITDQESVFSELEEENEHLKENCRRAEAQKMVLADKQTPPEEKLEIVQAPINWEVVKTTLQPFTVDLLELTANRLSTKYKRPVEPMQILVDMFMRYTLERWNEWFYPFVLKDHEIIKLANQINPEITTISHVKKLFSK